jgi:hypothetical protein
VAQVNVNGLNGAASNHVRPRANTISHVDLSLLGLMDGQQHGLVNRMNPLGLGMGNNTMGGLSGVGNFDYRGMSTAMGHHGNIHGLPKLDTQHINNIDINHSLRTAPAQSHFSGFDLDQLFTPHTTVNPAALHFGNAGQISSSNIPFGLDPSTNQQVPVDDDFMWMRNWNMQFSHSNMDENAIEESSPSRMSSGDSPCDYPDSMANSQAAMPIHNDFQWYQAQDLSLHHTISHSSTGPFQLDVLENGLPSLDGQNGTISPSNLHNATPTGESFFQSMMNQHLGNQQQPPQLSQLDLKHTPQGANYYGNPLESDSPSISNSSMTGSASARQSSVTSMSTESITDSTRQALLNSLSQPSVFGGHNHRKYSQPSVSSPLSPGPGSRNDMQTGPSLPSTADIRRYIESFVQYAHPHLPITHIATVQFDVPDSASPASASHRGSPSSPSNAQSGSGGQCLILGMAAIGALYEYDHPASKTLFEAAKKMISLYLEERRRADMSAAVNGTNSGETPLWLVQAMLLTVLYGHHCGDRVAADIASNHVAALVSLARAANLAKPQDGSSPTHSDSVEQQTEDTEMGEAGMEHIPDDLQTRWLAWKTREERKRCFFAIFILSSLLTTAYNQTPTIMNSEILLDLPCEEALYEARSAEQWQELGGQAAAEASCVSFATALSVLLSAYSREDNGHEGNSWNGRHPLSQGDTCGDNDIKPSTFGCLVLINALHNYIWETRSRHRGREWTLQETESMVQHIEPALNAWQAAWKANEHHKLERPNPFGLGPLAADSIPLLDLAFVRLYVNLGRTAEAFWRRDFDGMAEELANFRDMEGGSPNDTNEQIEARQQSVSRSPLQLQSAAQRRMSQAADGGTATRREKHLRKAAFYSADSLMIACSYSLTYCDPHAHELPIQSAICFFDCVQVMAEWATTIQERTGPYLGVLGRDAIDYTQVPAIMLLEGEDVELLRKIEQICASLEGKRLQTENLLAMDSNGLGAATVHNGVHLNTCGFGSKILRVTAMMLEKAVIWPSKCPGPRGCFHC